MTAPQHKSIIVAVGCFFFRCRLGGAKIPRATVVVKQKARERRKKRTGGGGDGRHDELSFWGTRESETLLRAGKHLARGVPTTTLADDERARGLCLGAARKGACADCAMAGGVWGFFFLLLIDATEW